MMNYAILKRANYIDKILSTPFHKSLSVNSNNAEYMFQSCTNTKELAYECISNFILLN